jgi:DNA-binding protein HU-beta
MSTGLSCVIDAAEIAPLVSPPRSAFRAGAAHITKSRGIVSVNKMDLIAAVADETDLSRIKATEVVDAVFNAIEGALKKKEEVRLVGFGTFATAERKAATGRNPRTGEAMAIAASTTVRFKAGKGLKDSVQ